MDAIQDLRALLRPEKLQHNWSLASGINTHVMDHGESLYWNSLELRITALSLNCLYFKVTLRECDHAWLIRSYIVNSLLLKETDQCYLRETIVTISVCYMENMFDWCLNVQWQYIVTIENEKTHNNSSCNFVLIR
jgi:hypothetical protein